MSTSWPPRFESTKEADEWMHKQLVAVASLEVRGPVWQAENGEYIGYTTERLPSGKFAVVIWQKDHPGNRWTYVREFRLRKDAKARAVELYAERSPRWRRRQTNGKYRAGDPVL